MAWQEMENKDISVYVAWCLFHFGYLLQGICKTNISRTTLARQPTTTCWVYITYFFAFFYAPTVSYLKVYLNSAQLTPPPTENKGERDSV